jgi:hypothetical protein
MAAVIRCGPASISTRAMTPSTSTDDTTPGKRLRADRRSPAACRAGRLVSRSTSLRGTRRRLRSSRTVASFPARSQRRSVSTLTPTAFAASPRLKSRIAEALHR